MIHLLAVTLTVFAASSLREGFTKIAAEFERQHPGVRVVTQFAGSQQLRLQLENGARADVFASADEAQMVRAKDLVREPAAFAHNEPVLVVPRDNPAGIQRFSDLPRARRIVLGAPDVPIGAYAERVLSAAGLDVSGRIASRELNTRQVLAKVALGEADAAIVYRTDALTARDDVRIVEIPRALNVPAVYLIAVVQATREPRLAAEFVAFVRASDALLGFGFSR